MPKWIETCVEKRVSAPAFFPEKDEKERKSIAWGICTKLYKKKHPEWKAEEIVAESGVYGDIAREELGGEGEMDPIKLMASQTRLIQPSEEDEELIAKMADGKRVNFYFEQEYTYVNKKNGNGHKILLKDTKAALPLLINAPVSLNHRPKAIGTYYSAKIRKESSRYPIVVVRGVGWKKYCQDGELEAIKSAYAEGTLAASWEIVNDDQLVRDFDAKDGSTILRNFAFSGGALICGIEPAYKGTKGKVSQFDASLNKLKEGGEGRVDEMWDLLAQAEELTDEEFGQVEAALHEWEQGGIEEAKKLTCEGRKALPDSDFAYVKTIKKKPSGGSRKVRRFPVQDEAHVWNALARLSLAKDLSAVEKDTIKRKILAKAKALGMTELLERHKVEKASLSLTTVETILLQEAKCPKCGGTWNKILSLDLEKQKARMQCASSECGRKFNVTYGVNKASQGGEETIEIKSDEGGEQSMDKVKFKFGETEIEAEKDSELAKALKSAQEVFDKVSQKKDEIAKERDGLKKEKEKAEAKAKLDELAEERVKKAEEIAKFPNDEERKKAKEKYQAMDEKDFDAELLRRENLLLKAKAAGKIKEEKTKEGKKEETATLDTEGKVGPPLGIEASAQGGDPQVEERSTSEIVDSKI